MLNIQASLTSLKSEITVPYDAEGDCFKKDDEIKKLKNELTIEPRMSSRTISENILTEKMTDLERKNKEDDKRRDTTDKRFQLTIEVVTYKTYAEITKTQKENLKSAVSEQKEEERREKRDIESRKNNIIGFMDYMKKRKTRKKKTKTKLIELLEVIDLSDIKPTRHHLNWS